MRPKVSSISLRNENLIIFYHQFGEERPTMSSTEREIEISNFKSVLVNLMTTLGGKICYEKELKKAYKDEEGKNINIILDKLDTTLLNFLRFQCRDICDITKLEGDFRIQRIPPTSSSDLLETKKGNKKKVKKNAAPKLK